MGQQKNMTGDQLVDLLKKSGRGVLSSACKKLNRDYSSEKRTIANRVAILEKLNEVLELCGYKIVWKVVQIDGTPIPKRKTARERKHKAANKPV